MTKKQYELLVLIDQRVRESGVPPSFDEMKEALSLRSKSGIHRLITGPRPPASSAGNRARLPKRRSTLWLGRIRSRVASGARRWQ